MSTTDQVVSIGLSLSVRWHPHASHQEQNCLMLQSDPRNPSGDPSDYASEIKFITSDMNICYVS